MNGQINGKQIRDNSIGLIKLNIAGSQGTYLLGTGSYLGGYEIPNNPLAYVNKQYVDSIAAHGLEQVMQMAL